MSFVEFQVGLMMGATAEEQVSLMIWFPLLPLSPVCKLHYESNFVTVVWKTFKKY